MRGERDNVVAAGMTVNGHDGGVVGGGAAADPFLSMLEKAEFVDDVGVSW